MTDSEKLALIKRELEAAAMPEFGTKKFWDAVEARCDNAANVIVDQAIVEARLLKVINEGS